MRKSPKVWSDVATQELLNNVVNNAVLLVTDRKGLRNQVFYKQIESRFLRKGLLYTWKEIREKWRNLKKQYKKFSTGEPNAACNWVYYNQMHQLLTKGPSNTSSSLPIGLSATDDGDLPVARSLYEEMQNDIENNWTPPSSSIIDRNSFMGKNWTLVPSVVDQTKKPEGHKTFSTTGTQCVAQTCNVSTMCTEEDFKETQFDPKPIRAKPLYGIFKNAGLDLTEKRSLPFATSKRKLPCEEKAEILEKLPKLSTASIEDTETRASHEIKSEEISQNHLATGLPKHLSKYDDIDENETFI
uniref:Uncharacterized protein LOC100177023 n=1 Tax=Phallusia mammillata TaxID=59560 RepID=A0A6F9DHB8_9ASCI|nr:uncharacterized protein LOC100177023 [Phallusia mammillata]